MKRKFKAAQVKTRKLAKMNASKKNMLLAIENKTAEIKQTHAGASAANTHLSLFRYAL